MNIKTRLVKALNCRKIKKHAFKCVKAYLKNGVYLFPNNASILRTAIIRDFFSKTIFYIFLNILSRGHHKRKDIFFSKGLAKYIFFIDDLCLCVPNELATYYYIKENYFNYHSIMTYPIAKILSFDDANHSFIMEKINGFHYYDEKHNKIILRKLLEYTIYAPMNYEKKECLQHGDASPKNVIWTSDDTFNFIDIDTISFKPLLFDYLHFSASIFTNIGNFLVTLNSFDRLIKIILEKYGFDFKDISSLDPVIANYVKWYMIHSSYIYHDCNYLSQLDKSLFPETVSLFD